MRTVVEQINYADARMMTRLQKPIDDGFGYSYDWGWDDDDFGNKQDDEFDVCDDGDIVDHLDYLLNLVAVEAIVVAVVVVVDCLSTTILCLFYFPLCH